MAETILLIKYRIKNVYVREIKITVEFFPLAYRQLHARVDYS